MSFEIGDRVTFYNDRRCIFGTVVEPEWKEKYEYVFVKWTGCEYVKRYSKAELRLIRGDEETLAIERNDWHPLVKEYYEQ